MNTVGITETIYMYSWPNDGVWEEIHIHLECFFNEHRAAFVLQYLIIDHQRDVIYIHALMTKW